MGFENVMINTYEMVKILLINPLILVFIYWIGFISIRKFANECFNITVHIALLQVFKLFVYGAAVVAVFFYDFKTKTLSFDIPSEMYLSTFLVGCFAMYEAISCLINLPQALFGSAEK